MWIYNYRERTTQVGPVATNWLSSFTDMTSTDDEAKCECSSSVVIIITKFLLFLCNLIVWVSVVCMYYRYISHGLEL